ncbi:hypothetical protein M3Y96_00453700 [Aphelenchoides besseyi]|nr:hypothetical protein M3Y96_00453700 [Aphelenchoides besseyi]
MLISRELNSNIKKADLHQIRIQFKILGTCSLRVSFTVVVSAAPPPSKDLPAAVNKRIIPPNSVIQTTSHQYIVQKQLGSGSFGDVYCVERKRDRLRMAVKIEWVKEGADQRLPKYDK